MKALLALILAYFLGSAATAGSRAAQHQPPEPQPAAEEDYLGDDFVYDVVARTNEGVVRNIDTTDLAGLAVLAAIAAVVVFGIDKIRELAPPWEWVSYSLLAASAVVCVIGYLIGVFKTREPIDPRRFMIDFAADPEGTTANVTLGTVHAYYQNARDRKAKRIAVAVALALLVAGTVVIAVARSTAAVVK